MKDVYATVTRRIMDALAQGVVPWQRPWDAQQGRPRNLVTDKPYPGHQSVALAHGGRLPVLADL